MTDQCYILAYRMGDEDSWRAIVNHYTSQVYHSAMRQTDARRAGEITSVVMAMLAQQSQWLAQQTCIAGWLHEATQAAVRHFRAAGSGVVSSEQLMHHPPLASQSVTLQIGARLDDALAELSRDERDAVLLHYIEKLSLEDTAMALAIELDVAANRTIRALNRLRVVLGSMGIAIPLAALGNALADFSSAAVPAGLLAAAIAAPQSPRIAQLAAQLRSAMAREQYLDRAKKWTLRLTYACAIMMGVGVVSILINGGLSFGTPSPGRTQNSGTMTAPTLASGFPAPPENAASGPLTEIKKP